MTTPAVSRALALHRAGASLYAAAAVAGASYQALCRAARRAGLDTQHDHCTACGGTDHRAVRGRCSPTHLAALDVLDRGVTPAVAARTHGVGVGSIYRAVERMRAARLRAEAKR